MADCTTSGTVSPGITGSQSYSVTPLSNLNKSLGQNSIHINNLPFDIFVLIWNLARATDDNDRLYFPVVVSHVCRTWRHYALQVSSFWSTIDFRTRKVNTEKAQLWLQRSKNSPVSINIGSKPFQEASIPKVKLIMRVIMPHLGHCRSLRVQEVPEKVARVIFDRLRDASAPVLEVLELSTEDGTNWEPKPFREGTAPPLLDLSIERRFQKYFLERFTNLRRLRVVEYDLRSTSHSENVTYVHKVLSKLPQLEILAIDFNGATDDLHIVPINLPSPQTHDCLRHLSLHVSATNRNAILASLNLPYVRYFPNHKAPLLELPLGLCNLGHMKRTHPFPRLLSLCLGGACGLSPFVHYDPGRRQRTAENLSHLEGALSGAPLLESLTFEYVEFGGDKTISCLSRVCPRLEWLTIHTCTGCTLKGIMSIVEGRRARKGFEPLRHLIVREWHWDAKLIDDKVTWGLLEQMLEAKSTPPGDSTNLYLSRFDVK